jgi:hypothetical protein
MSTSGRNLKNELLGALAVLVMLASAVGLAAVLTRDPFGAGATPTPASVGLAPTAVLASATTAPTALPPASVTPAFTTAAPIGPTATSTGTPTLLPVTATVKPTVLAIVPAATTALPATSPATFTPETVAATATAPATIVVPPTSMPVRPSATLPAKPTERPTRTPMPTATNTPTERPTSTATSTPPPTQVPTWTPLPPSPLPSATPVPTVAPTETPTITLATPVTPEVSACTPPPDWLPYTIRSGENLFRLSLRAGIPLQEMQRINCIPNARDISAGRILYVPPSFFARPPSSAPGSTTGFSGSSLPLRVGCTAAGSQITFPAAGSALTGRVGVSGSATLGSRNNDFSFYKVELRVEGEAGLRNIHQATTPVAAGLLASLNTADFGPGNYQIKLTVVDITGNYLEPCAIHVTFR